MPVPNKKIFCNTPWYELHIYWDGGLGICCQEYQRLYSTEHKEKYNISKMSIAEWFNSDPVKKMRMDMWGDKKLFLCNRCMKEEEVGVTSRRHKSNQKSVIFTKSAFEDSIKQSPHYDNFLFSKNNHGETQTLPVDLHIDLGNFCNLACKMCHSQASSKIAAQQVKWGNVEDKKYLGVDWTQNENVWNKFLKELLGMKLKNIHFMGGETILTKRFHDFLNFMIENKKFDLNFSFVTNGTIFDFELIKKLKKFQRVGIEVSIETITSHNAYSRQGTKTQEVLENIEKYNSECDNDKISLTMRSAVSALTIGHYHTLLEYCLENKFNIKPLIVTKPSFLQVCNLPINIKKQYLEKYYKLLEKFQLNELDVNVDFNESDPNQYKKIIKLAIVQAIGLLTDKMPDNHKDELRKMVEHCVKWDKEYDYDAITLFPELTDIFVENGY
jgi:organic radical activating enzyme